MAAESLRIFCCHGLGSGLWTVACVGLAMVRFEEG